MAELLATSSEEEESSDDGYKKPPPKKMQKTAKKGQKKSEQLTLFGAGVKRICNKSVLVGSMILLTDKIYAKKIPEGMKGKLFFYKITSFDTETELFSVRYQQRMITSDGGRWIDQDEERATMDDFLYEQMLAGRKLHEKALGRVAAYNEKDIEVAVKTLKSMAVRADEVDVADLDEAALKDSNKGWQSEDVMKVSRIIHVQLVFVPLHISDL